MCVPHHPVEYWYNVYAILFEEGPKRVDDIILKSLGPWDGDEIDKKKERSGINQFTYWVS